MRFKGVKIIEACFRDVLVPKATRVNIQDTNSSTAHITCISYCTNIGEYCPELEYQKDAGFRSSHPLISERESI